ncbi:MAG: glycosyltransferase family 39 protein [Thermomicrobiales bacterium]|nr:glycosyltransferase family 39 protein [Thermomicrobiales bacterium]
MTVSPARLPEDVRHRRYAPGALPARIAVARWAHRHGLIAAVLLLYALCAILLPTMTPAGVGDDWVYVRSVETLTQTGQVRVLDLAVITLLFQIAWGALFAALFGPGFGVLRVATVVMTLLGGWACYGVCRELGVTRERSALGAAAYLFNPLAFVLAYTFMSDPYFTALLVIALWATLRGLRPGDGRWLLAGGVVAASAFLVRQQGALIPPTVLVGMALAGRWRPTRAGSVNALRIAGPLALAMIGYYGWLLLIRGAPEQQQQFSEAMIDAGFGQSLLLVARMGFISLMYVGLFALPLAAIALAAGWRALIPRGRFGWVAIAAWVVALAVGIAHFERLGLHPPPMPRMPYVPQYLSPDGLGPTDLRGGRVWLVGWPALAVLTAVCAASSLLWLAPLARRLDSPRRPDPAAAGALVIAAVLLGQAAGTIPPSFHFRNWIVSVDRYLLPLLPLALALGLWALRGASRGNRAAWLIVALLGCFAFAGTRDLLVFQGATWRLAQAAVDAGTPLTQLDAGASWDGYHLYDYSVANHIPTQTPHGPWWTDLFAKATDSTFVVATTPQDGYVFVAGIEYSSWLHGGPQPLYLLRREESPAG